MASYDRYGNTTKADPEFNVNKRTLGWGCGGVLAVIFGLFLLLGIHNVDNGQVGVVKNFGHVSGDLLDPGFHWVLPFVNSVDDVDTKIQTHDLNEIDAATSELQSVKITGKVNWHIEKKDVTKVYQRIDIHNIDGILDSAFNDFVKQTTPNYSVEVILNKRDEIRQDAKVALTGNLANYGVVVDDIYIKNIGFSDQYEKAIEEKQVAQQQVQTAQQQQDKAKIEAQTQVISAQGEADANKAKQTSITPALIQYIAAQKWDGKLPQYLGGNAVPFLDITGSKPQ